MISKRIFLALAISAMLAVSTVAVRAQSSEEGASVLQQEKLGGGILDLVEQAKQAQIKAFAGSWEGVLTPEEGGPPPFRILFTFGADGTVVASDAGPPNPHLNTAEHGAWERTGDNEFTIIYKQLLFDAAGNLDTLFKGRVRFKLSTNQTEITGLVKVNIFLPSGETIIAGAGTIKCTKIRIESLD